MQVPKFIPHCAFLLTFALRCYCWNLFFPLGMEQINGICFLDKPNYLLHPLMVSLPLWSHPSLGTFLLLASHPTHHALLGLTNLLLGMLTGMADLTCLDFHLLEVGPLDTCTNGLIHVLSVTMLIKISSMDNSLYY